MNAGQPGCGEVGLIKRGPRVSVILRLGMLVEWMRPAYPKCLLVCKSAGTKRSVGGWPRRGGVML